MFAATSYVKNKLNYNNICSKLLKAFINYCVFRIDGKVNDAWFICQAQKLGQVSVLLIIHKSTRNFYEMVTFGINTLSQENEFRQYFDKWYYYQQKKQYQYTALHRSLSKYLTAQDTCGTPTLTKNNRILARLGNLLYLQSWYMIKVNSFQSIGPLGRCFL